MGSVQDADKTWKTPLGRIDKIKTTMWMFYSHFKYLIYNQLGFILAERGIERKTLLKSVRRVQIRRETYL